MTSCLPAHPKLVAQVGGHDHHGIAEIHRPALAIGQPAVVQQLQQHIEDLRVGLFDLIEQHHAVRPPAHRFGELPAFLIADISRRRADQPRDRVLLLVFAHVDPHHRPLVIEQELRQGTGQLGLAHPGWSEENERADRAVRVLQARPASAALR